ncbi:MAG: ImmA/IrrE family metallo-endopeptidase [Oscillospiraceae bacterium]|nr:ImmA/IrrE family metallo-endopeptidase [Oscillospiraceae bacterium]
MTESRKWKCHVDKAFEELCEVLNDDRYLDHEIRAVEWILTNTETYRKKNDYYRPYTIIRKKRASLSWEGKRGCAFLYEYGAQILYLKEGTRLQKMIVIGHELAHIYLHHLNLNGVSNSDNLSDNRFLETQATYFSKKVIERRTDLFNDNEYINDRKFNKQTINERILDFQSDYNEKMHDEENEKEEKVVLI